MKAALLNQAVERVGYHIGYHIGRRLGRKANSHFSTVARQLPAPLSIDTMRTKPRITPEGLVWDVVAESTCSMIR